MADTVPLFYSTANPVTSLCTLTVNVLAFSQTEHHSPISDAHITAICCVCYARLPYLSCSTINLLCSASARIHCTLLSGLRLYTMPRN